MVIEQLTDSDIVANWTSIPGGTEALGIKRGPTVGWKEMAGELREDNVVAIGEHFAAYTKYLPVFVALVEVDNGNLVAAVRKAAEYLKLPIDHDMTDVQAPQEIHRRNRELAGLILWGPMLLRRDFLAEKIRTRS